MSTTSDRSDPRLTHGADDHPVPQSPVYLVLSDAERARGFVRPVRTAYVHVDGCGATTTMTLDIAETYAANPGFYGATYCTGCRRHRPVGAHGEFVWVPADGEGDPIAPEYRRVGS
jgi:hypothetical protein